MVKVDEIDIAIITKLYNLKENAGITTYSLALSLFPDVKSHYDKQIKTNFVQTRLRKLGSYGIIDIQNDNGRYYYDLILDNFVISELNERKLKIKCRAMFLKIEGKWMALEL